MNNTMNESLMREMVENHWRYNKGIIDIMFDGHKTIDKDIAIKLMGYFYKKAMIHGIKHGKEGKTYE